MLHSVPLSTEDLEFKNPIEWEERREGFLLENFWLTLKRVLLSPQEFFENLRRNGSLMKPLLYACGVELLTAILSSLIWGGIVLSFLLGSSGHWGVLAGNFKIVNLFLGFLLLVLSLFISSFAYYGITFWLGVRSPFRTVFRVYCYSESAVLFRLIPLIGIFAAEVARLVLLYFGFKTVFRFTPARAAICAVLPGVALWILVALCGFSFFHWAKA